MIAKYRDVVVPSIGQQSGSQGLLLLVDRNTGKSISIGLWDSEADAKAYETSGAFREVVAQFGDLIEAAPARELYEIVVKEGI